jgi:hypothetical protein
MACQIDHDAQKLYKHMAQKDLIPTTQRSKDEAKELGRLGGINSGKARKRKKELKERIILAFEIYTKKLKECAKTKEDRKTIDQMGADVFQIMSIAYDSKTRKETRLKALDMLWDRTVGKPTQQIDQTIVDRTIQQPIYISTIPAKNATTQTETSTDDTGDSER